MQAAPSCERFVSLYEKCLTPEDSDLRLLSNGKRSAPPLRRQTGWSSIGKWSLFTVRNKQNIKTDRVFERLKTPQHCDLQVLSKTMSEDYTPVLLQRSQLLGNQVASRVLGFAHSRAVQYSARGTLFLTLAYMLASTVLIWIHRSLLFSAAA